MIFNVNFQQADDYSIMQFMVNWNELTIVQETYKNDITIISLQFNIVSHDHIRLYLKILLKKRFNDEGYSRNMSCALNLTSTCFF
jgi:hypothetical protein